MINGFKCFFNIKEYDTIQFTITYIFEPFIAHLDEGRSVLPSDLGGNQTLRG